MFDPMFVPPRHNEALYRFANAFLPRLAPLFGNVYDVHVPDEDLARLEAVRSSRALICPNHPTETDPIVLFWLARKLGQPFNYLATREVLDGPRGRLLNHLGVYSVIRGFPDRESLRMSRRLLAEMDRKVVIFPEGQVYERNDLLMTFHTGVAQIGFWALDDLQKAGREPALPLVPVALKYRCRTRPDAAIARGLRALEGALELPPGEHLSDYQRLRRAGGAVLARLERDEGLAAVESGESQEFGPRIEAVRRAALERVMRAIGVQVDDRQPPADQLHEAFVELKRWVGLPDDDPSDYDERRYRQRLEVAAPLFRELLRLQNFIAMTGDYVASNPTAERFLEVLCCLQLEVFGKVRHRAPLDAVVRVGSPIALEERHAEYRRSKRDVVDGVTREVQTRIRSMLQDLQREATPISLGS